jgi:hypothetical protein
MRGLLQRLEEADYTAQSAEKAVARALVAAAHKATEGALQREFLYTSYLDRVVDFGVEQADRKGNVAWRQRYAEAQAAHAALLAGIAREWTDSKVDRAVAGIKAALAAAGVSRGRVVVRAVRGKDELFRRLAVTASWRGALAEVQDALRVELAVTPLARGVGRTKVRAVVTVEGRPLGDVPPLAGLDPWPAQADAVGAAIGGWLVHVYQGAQRVGLKAR